MKTPFSAEPRTLYYAAALAGLAISGVHLSTAAPGGHYGLVDYVLVAPGVAAVVGLLVALARRAQMMDRPVRPATLAGAAGLSVVCTAAGYFAGPGHDEIFQTAADHVLLLPATAVVAMVVLVVILHALLPVSDRK